MSNPTFQDLVDREEAGDTVPDDGGRLLFISPPDPRDEEHQWCAELSYVWQVRGAWSNNALSVVRDPRPGALNALAELIAGREADFGLAAQGDAT